MSKQHPCADDLPPVKESKRDRRLRRTRLAFSWLLELGKLIVQAVKR